MPVIQKDATPVSAVLSLPAAQEYLGGYSRRSLYQLASQGEIDLIKVGGRSMVTRASLDAFLDRQIALAQASRPSRGGHR